MRLLTYPLLSLLFAALLLPTASAQIGMPNDPALAKEAMNRILIVVTDDLNEKEVKRYQKNGTYESIQKNHEERNARTLAYFKEHWTINKEIVSKTETEVTALRKAKSNDYAYVQLKRENDTKMKTEDGFNKTYHYEYYVLTLQLTDEPKPLATITSRGKLLQDMEYLFAIKTLQYLTNFVASGPEYKNLEEPINKNAPLLKEKTLLIPNYLTILEKHELEAAYPYGVKIVDEATIVEHILNKDADYAYVYVNHKLSSCGTRFNHFIVDCGDGSVLLLDMRSNVSVWSGHYQYVANDSKRVLDKDSRVPSFFQEKFIKTEQLEGYVETIEAN